MNDYAPSIGVSGGILQSAFPKGGFGMSGPAHGLNLRGVVVRLYTRDDPPPGMPSPAATYAAVATYGVHRLPLPRVLVTQPLGSRHTGQLGGLRAATVGAGVVDLDHLDPGTLDGSHVVVSFLDDDLAQPYVSAVLEHPRADGGGPISGDIEDRVRLAKTDGRPLLWRWNGAVWGLNGDGDFVIDLEAAHDGELVNGAEPAPATDGSRGNLNLRLPQGAKLTVTIGGGASFTLELADGTARLVLGDGTHSVAIAEHLQQHLEALKSWIYNELIVQTSFGPSAPPASAGAPPPPAWATTIASTKLKLPNT